jgi:predicted small lipoprotein YifL
MRNILLVAALVTLSACGASAPTKAPEKQKSPEEAIVGMYKVTMPDGSMMISSITKDHNYIDSVSGQVTEWGTWTLKDGKFCSTPQTEGAKPSCISLSEPAADGTITVTSDDGTITKAEKLS